MMNTAMSLVAGLGLLAHPAPAADVSAVAPAQRNVEYTINFEQRGAQIVTIDLTLRDWNQPTLEVHLPVWRPGRYEVLDSSGGVRSFSASDSEGGALQWEKTNKASWKIITPAPGDVIIRYGVYANSISNRTRHVDDSHAFLSGASVFMYCHERRNEPLRVTLQTPPTWNIASGMETDPADAQSLLADGYDTLVDSPIETGIQTRRNFTVAGVPHEHVFWGRTDVVPDVLTEDTRKIAQVQYDLFGSFPYTRYVFITHIGAGLGGGTEHLNSTIMQCRPTAFDDPKAYRNYLSLISHELFHTWNVKQFRPVGLKPYEYQRENYTTLLWVAEGTTSYYDELLCARAGVWTAEQYLTALGEMIEAELIRPGAALQSLEESSYDAWVKFNKATPDAINSTVNFYTKGAVVNFMLDADIRERANNTKSLDDVMRELNKRFPLAGPGAYSNQDLLSILTELTGFSYVDFFKSYISGRDPLNPAPALAYLGLEWSTTEKDATKDSSADVSNEAGTKPPEKAKSQPGTLGVDVKDVDGAAVVTVVRADGPAFAGKEGAPGLLTDDQIVALDGLRIRGTDWESRIKALTPGTKVTLTYFRRERLYEVTFEVRPAPIKRTLKRAKNPTPAQEAAYNAWMGVR
jgi:predicted metalloprotease with PDZ domain